MPYWRICDRKGLCGRLQIACVGFLSLLHRLKRHNDGIDLVVARAKGRYKGVAGMKKLVKVVLVAIALTVAGTAVASPALGGHNVASRSYGGGHGG